MPGISVLRKSNSSCVCVCACVVGAHGSVGVWIALMNDKCEKNYLHSRGYGVILLRSIEKCRALIHDPL